MKGKNNLFKGILYSFLIVCLLTPVLVVGCAQKEEAPELKDTITIGSVVDFSGPVARADGDIWKGRQDYWRYVNEEKGGISGYTIEETTIDGKFDVSLMLPAMDRLAQELDAKFIYMATQVVFAACREKAAGLKIPVMATSALPSYVLMTEADIAAGKKNYSFAHNPLTSSRIAAEIMLVEQLWKEDRPPRVAGVFLEGPMGIVEAKAVEIYCEEAGFPYLGSIWLEAAPTEATSQVAQIKEWNVDYILAGKTTEVSVAVFLKELDRQGVNAKQIQADQTLGIVYKDSNFDPVFDGHMEILYTVPADAVDVPEIKKIRDHIFEWYPDPEEAEQHLTAYCLTGWHSGIIIEEMLRIAIEKYGADNLTGDNLLASLESIRDLDVGGLTGPISYYPDSHEGASAALFREMRGGEMPLVCDWLQPPPLTGGMTDPSFWE